MLLSSILGAGGQVGREVVLRGQSPPAPYTLPHMVPHSLTPRCFTGPQLYFNIDYSKQFILTPHQYSIVPLDRILIQEEEGLNYLCSENIDVDQLHGLPLSLSAPFSHNAKTGFLMMQLLYPIT